MTLQELADRVSPELLEWFSTSIDEGDAPELHLVDLREGDLVRCFDALQQRAPQWNDRLFYLDAEQDDVTVAERPDVAELVASRRASHACIGAHGIRVEETELPLVEMFLFVDEIQFFWWPDAAWTRDRVAGFFVMAVEMLALAPHASLRPDPRYPLPDRRRLGAAIAQAIGGAGRVELHAPAHQPPTG